MRAYLLNVAIAFDQLVNALLGGDPDETISARAARCADRMHWKWLVVFLEWIDPGHCERARKWHKRKRTNQ